MPLTKALIINTDSVIPIPIPVQFNPPQYELRRSTRYADVNVPGLDSAPVQFVGGDAQTLSLELFFDTTDLGLDVRLRVEPLVVLTRPDAKTHAPPRLLFLWGTLAFPCVLESLSQKYEQFNAAGMPLRASVSVTLKGHDLIEDLLASIPLQSVDRAKQVVAAAGATLQQIAAQEYDDPRKWRAIAEANGIDNPLRLPVGKKLNVPVLS